MEKNDNSKLKRNFSNGEGADYETLKTFYSDLEALFLENVY